MANISGASLTQIQQRLRDTPAYHPFDADTFCDWAMEAGDIVTVRRGDESYQSPIHSSRLVWRGKQNMELNASGTKERDAIARVSKQKYARGGYGMRQQKSLYYEFYSEDGYLHSYIQMSESILVTHFDNSLSDLHSEFSQTAEKIQSSVWANESLIYSTVEQTATYIKSEVASAESRMGSSIYQTASGIRSDVWAAESLIYSTIEQTASNIRAEVISAESRMGSSIEMAASGIRSDVWAANSTIYSTIEQTASRIDQTVAKQQNDLTELKGRVIVEAGKASLVAEITDNRRIIYYRTMDDFPDVGDPNIICLDTSTGKYYEWKASAHGYVETEPNKVIKASSITTAINEAGDSETHIDSDHIYIGNQKSTIVINGKITANDVTADFIAGKLATLSTLTVNGITSSGSVSFSGTTTLSGSVQIQGSDGNTRNLATGIRTLYKASESEGVVTLQYIDFNGTTHDVTFNKAVATISGSWSDGTLTVSKDPNGSSTYSSVIDSVLANGQVTYANQILTVPVTVMVRNNGGSQAGTGYSGTLAVGAGLAYTAGQNSVNVTTSGWDSGIITFSPSAGTGSSGSTKIDAVLSNGTVTYSNKVLSVPIKVMAKVGSGSQTETGYTSTLSVGAGLAYDAGYGDAQLTGVWDKTTSSLTNNNRITISKTTSGSSNPLAYVISAAAIIEYNSTTHKYTARAKAKVDGTQRGDDATDTGGTEAYNAGLADEKTLVRTRFGYASNTYYIEAYENTSGSPSISGTSTSYKLGLKGTTVQIQNSSGTKISNTATYAIPLEEKTITENSATGYTPSSGYVGFSKVKVNVQAEHSLSISGFTSRGSTDPGSSYTNITGITPSVAGNWYTFSTYCGSVSKAYRIKVSPSLTTKKITSNNTYTPASGYVGFSSVEVAVPDPHTFGEKSFSSNGTYYASTYSYSGFSKVVVSVPSINDIKLITTDGNFNSAGYYNCTVTTNSGDSVSYNAASNKGLKLDQMAFTVSDSTANGTYRAVDYGKVGFDAVVVSKGSSGATLDYIGVDPNRPADAYILNGDKQPYVITSAKTTYWFLIKAMNGSTQLDAKYLGVGTNVSTSGGHNNPIKFTRGAAGTAPNTYTWSAIIGTNVTGNSTQYTFYY